ncbi:hypothetical protein GGTG_01784 [Gaeumannomyces tritici R3-111a-1]|uniref:Uncharacterized protein n=1 Tax=Gaeumannomyces tritici (strain R3-111a-1) TaxID=644352 RepID=J3NKJ3_GAET3|nr:hypothetical protein GGTG_01784 [Gaeumannomyces tritici R3-111a-1]EJT81810.1 hypothetical protein GGTG_01784 [Gaeumannomyces tritici R3-111a-1]
MEVVTGFQRARSIGKALTKARLQDAVLCNAVQHKGRRLREPHNGQQGRSHGQRWAECAAAIIAPKGARAARVPSTGGKRTDGEDLSALGRSGARPLMLAALTRPWPKLLFDRRPVKTACGMCHNDETWGSRRQAESLIESPRAISPPARGHARRAPRRPSESRANSLDLALVAPSCVTNGAGSAISDLLDRAPVAAPIDRRGAAASLRPRDDAGGSDSSQHQGDASFIPVTLMMGALGRVAQGREAGLLARGLA